MKTTFYLLATLIFFGGLVWFLNDRSGRRRLPPTDLKGHVELSPRSHILYDPMSEPIQKHMLEHADGMGRPGVVIQYNCQDFGCERDLITRLEELVKQYDYVYLAPNDYDGKIILTKYQDILVLEQFDRDKIINFIEN